MSSVFDVARYILSEQEKLYKEKPISTWKLQKLVYYSQAWAVVWDNEPIFPEKLEAWANGPVCRELYNVHKGLFNISKEQITGNISKIKNDHKETILQVLKYYGKKSPHFLSRLTHQEQPWIRARDGLNPGERGQNEITLDSMSEYYDGLLASTN